MSETENPDPSDAPLQDLGGEAPATNGSSLDTLLDVSMPLTIEIGRTEMTVHEILQLGAGSVIQLYRVVGEPVDVFVGDRKLAQGEVVVVGEHFGVRVTRVLPGQAAEISS